MNYLHPGAKWQFRLRGLVGSLVFLWVISWILFIPFQTLLNNVKDSPAILFSLGIGVIIAYIIVAVIAAEIYARMSYNRWFYEFTKDNLKLERGIIWKRYSNVPYERVQNVDITRGILARIFGFSTVNIQTAGFSYSGNKSMHSEGYIPAVSPEEAERIRDFLMKKISKNRQGL